MPVEKICLVCGTKFNVPPVRAETAQTCSRACKGKLWTKQNEESRPIKVCKVCGKTYSCPPSHEDRRQCCSARCANKSRSVLSDKPGTSNANWRGGSSGHTDGYLYVLANGHPFAKNGSYVFEHRLVMEERMRAEAPDHKFLIEVDGVKYLRPEIHVHHIDENKRNNKRANLIAVTPTAHRLIHDGQPPMEGEVWPAVAGQVPYALIHVRCSCEVCGTSFLRKRSDVARSKGKFYCSRACYDRRPREAFPVTYL